MPRGKVRKGELIIIMNDAGNARNYRFPFLGWRLVSKPCLEARSGLIVPSRTG